MARMPGATWRPVPNCTKGGQDSVRGVVLHVMAGTLDGSDSWFRNPAAQASAHFGVGKDGRIFQWVDTADRAWAQADGNRTWLSIEHEGQGGDSLTAKQLTATASIVAWMHKTHGVKLQNAESPSGTGIGWHGMGGAAWGGHTACPGTPIKNQRGAIIAAAGGNPAPPTPGGGGVARYQVTINGLKYGYGASGSQVTQVGKALVAHGCGKHYSVGPGPDWGDADTENYADYQRSLGYTGTDADGVPGEATLKKLLGKLPGKAPATTPKVDLSNLIAAAKADPKASQGHVTHAADVKLVEAALKAEGLLAAAYASDGSFGSVTVAAYAAWQRRCGYTGTAADGIPGQATLAALGKKHGFTVTP
jgi:hypothetical protein